MLLSVRLFKTSRADGESALNISGSVLFPMDRKTARKLAHAEMEMRRSDEGSFLRQIILGGQDGLVNVLGVLLGVASGTSDTGIVIIAGLAATFAESISMAAVAYTSSKAEQDFYRKEFEREKREIRELPEVETEEIRLIYMKKGFRGSQLNSIVKKITSDQKVWLQVMMQEELGLSESEKVNPLREGIVVGLAALAGSLVPLIPFFLLPLQSAVIASLAVSIMALFAMGAYKGKLTLGDWMRSGFEIAVIGMIAAIAGYAIGAAAGNAKLGTG